MPDTDTRLEDKIDALREQLREMGESFNAQFRSLVTSINGTNSETQRMLVGLAKDFEAHEKQDKINHEQQDKDIGRAFTALRELKDDVIALKEVHQQGKGAALAWKVAAAVGGALIGVLELYNLVKHP